MIQGTRTPLEGFLDEPIVAPPSRVLFFEPINPYNFFPPKYLVDLDVEPLILVLERSVTQRTSKRDVGGGRPRGPSREA